MALEYRRTRAVEQTDTTLSRGPAAEDRAMTKYLISFPGSAMDISDEDMAAVGEAATRSYARRRMPASMCSAVVSTTTLRR